MSVKLEVGTCPTCGEGGAYPSPSGGPQDGSYNGIQCFTCGGTGQVIGVPKDQIVVADGTTKRGLTFPKIEQELTSSYLRTWWASSATIEEFVWYLERDSTVPVAVVNLMMQEEDK